MEALRLQKKYPEVTRDEMFDLINRFKCVYLKSYGYFA
jgi:plastin-1